jgi:hypothetical protein
MRVPKLSGNANGPWYFLLGLLVVAGALIVGDALYLLRHHMDVQEDRVQVHSQGGIQ